MNKLTSILLIVFFLANACNTNRFPLIEKRYWTPDDYHEVITEIDYRTPEGEEYPRFANPETAPVIKKLVDAENYKVVLEDPELGLNYKAELSGNFFEQYQIMNRTYRKTDRQDNYIYAEELIAIEQFGLGLQLQYFKLGIDRIKGQADSENSEDVTETLHSNLKRLVDNFDIYLDEFKEADHFSTAAPKLADGVTTYFFKLIEMFPDADYTPMSAKASAMLEKTKDQGLKNALSALLAKIESVKKPAEMTNN